MSSAGTTRCALASWATSCSPCNTVLLGRGPTTTPSSVAMATRFSSTASPTVDLVTLCYLARPRATAAPRPRRLAGPRPGGPRPAGRPAAAAPRNSKRRNISRSCERSGGASTSSAGSQSMSRSRRIVASSFELRAWSACSRERLRARRASARRRARARPRASRTAAISCDAVLSPIPGTPAMLSEVSPFRPMKSGTLSGGDPEPGLDALGRVDVHVGDAARGHHQADVLGDELERVAVGRDDARRGRRPRRRASRAWRSRRPPPSPRTRGCGSRTPRRSAGSTGTARGAGPASAGGPPCTRRRARRGAPGRVSQATATPFGR